MLFSIIKTIEGDSKKVWFHGDCLGINAEASIELCQQNAEYFEIYDHLVNNVSTEDQINMLKFNQQMVLDTDEQVN